MQGSPRALLAPSIFQIHNTFRECVSTGAAGARTRRFSEHHLLHPLILRLLVLCAPADFEAHHLLHPQIQIPNAFPAIPQKDRVQ